RAFEIGGVKARQPGDFLLLGGDQRRPVEADLTDRPAEGAGVSEAVGEAAGVNEDLLWHAAADDAGSANAELLGDRDLGAVSSGDARRPRAAGARADDEQIVVEGHRRLARVIPTCDDRRRSSP